MYTFICYRTVLIPFQGTTREWKEEEGDSRKREGKDRAGKGGADGAAAANRRTDSESPER